MNDDISLMIKIYNTKDIDWMGNKINDISCLTKHHIVKKEDGGIDDISNYALLTEDSHHLLNYIEEHYYKEYMIINNMFLTLNRSLSFPNKDYYENMFLIIKKINKSIKNKRRGR